MGMEMENYFSLEHICHSYKNPIKINNILHGHPLKSLEKAKYLGLTIRQAM